MASSSTAIAIPPLPHDHPNKLRDTFASAPITSHTSVWDALYAEAFKPWDRDGPSLALADLLAQRTDLIPAPQERDSRGKSVRDASGGVIRRSALVPGCGPGHDVLLLSSLGYDAFGLDFSEGGLDVARRNERAASEEGKYLAVDESLEKGRVTWLKGDFFAQKWEGGDGGEATDKFDLIFDYTFLCALDPSMRPSWAKRMSELLAPGGQLICLEFPFGKPLSEQGPPWGLWPEVYEELLAFPGENIEYNDDGTVKSESAARMPHPEGLHRVCLVKPLRTHKAGTDEDGHVRDFISVWSR